MQKILIANRGEIACRIIRTAKSMGIKTVAIYSQVDHLLPHVDMADEAYCIGNAPSRESYLNIDKIIGIAKDCGADAIHPGYGFLSEKADFAKAVTGAGLIFIGPSADVIHCMGDKLEAKALAKSANVTLVPGSTSALSNIAEAREFARQHGYPVLLKAAAGGGGKGMRVVTNDLGLQEGFERARSEALSAFGDERVFIEKYIETPRHIEIQILADQHGNVIHLGERDCSLQRRHQKVVEESPSPFVSPTLRQEIAHQAVALAKKVGYTSAGTVEFIVSPTGEFYFLEMNTRLQVEHPVTEAVYGLDLVEWMIRIARGEKLTLKQADMQPSGHAIEVRLYAEDPSAGFLPSAGKLIQFRPPHSPAIRFDCGFTEGDQVSIYYDPMIAKVIAHAPTRPQALTNIIQYLDEILIKGLVSNQDFLIRLLRTADVQDGNYHTHYIQEQLGHLVGETATVTPDDLTLFAQAAMAIQAPSLSEQKFVVIMGKTILNDQRCDASLTWLYQKQLFTLLYQEQQFIGRHHYHNGIHEITINGLTQSMRVIDSRHWPSMQHLKFKNTSSDNKIVKAPMPGTIIALPIFVGQTVKKDEPLAIIEAMKMENVLKASQEGTISEICVKSGDSLVRDQVIVRFA
ncbi:acetyl/propionyl/methylcrotonyl-CoA carboxylase subunit alpha [Candidatus Odyssella acanthamoebae]|uniref:Acetyl-CoA carboxylase n=1 Tax=Candidatus Odyssella acanthamoebae TaxID=91604 RepID=A0A077AWQ5_9PROT|nr:acetyl-CoA carboxylase biotin carboxylase subunit [Candidatus Paracaedibacter acanthamoebae]AIK96073.1 acetyl-CoA carboxylase [Candidatus Paracaedibacter acanthamoebae]